jgi:hypothetical protein
MKRHNLEKKCGKVDLRYIEIDDDYEEDVRAFFKDIDLDEWFADEDEPYEVVFSDEWPSDDFGCGPVFDLSDEAVDSAMSQ